LGYRACKVAHSIVGATGARRLARGLIAATAVSGLLLGPSTATGATTVGAVFAPQAGGCVAASATMIQTGSPGNEYVVPGPGVVTSWSVQSGTNPITAARLKLAVPAPGNAATIVAESALVSPLPNRVNTYPARITVQGGELVGYFFETTGGPSDDCWYRTAAATYTGAQGIGDLPVGMTTIGNNGTQQFPVAVALEPDADGDGFGDETQDGCAADPSTQGACPPPPPPPAPDTTITAQPKSKSKSKEATFEFTSSIAGSTFECSLDGEGFSSCLSPRNLKVRKGKHTFQVRATASGVTDPTPALYEWIVKKKKKKKK
jgi:hypothetical protein